MNNEAKKIDLETQEKKFVFQFVSKDTGQRSEPFTTTFHKLYESLEASEDPNHEDYILLVAVLEEQNTTIPATPLITVGTFMSNYNLEPLPGAENND